MGLMNGLQASLKATNTLVNGRMEKRTGTAPILTPVGTPTLANSGMINATDKEPIPITMERNMLVNGEVVKNMEKEPLLGLSKQRI